MSTRYLDSARGIAAMMVFVMHFYERKYQGQNINSYLSIIFNGRDAVSFFFLLSGFVLSYKYIVLGKPLDVKKFYIGRFFRLWPAFFITVIINCLLVFYIHDLMSWHKLVDVFVFNKDGFWEEAFLLRFHNNFYGPGWTLTMEMVGSFLLPFYIVIAIKDKRLVTCLILVFYFVIGQNFYSSIQFLLGILISCNYSQINEASFQQKKWFKFRYLILFAAIVLWPARYYDDLHHFGPKYRYLSNYFGIDAFSFSSLSSAVFLVVILYSKQVQIFLGNRVLVYIGKLSYSIYLVHTFACGVIYDFFEKNIPFKNVHIVVICMITGYIILTFSLAILMHYFVELPFMRIGKRVVNHMKPSLVIIIRENDVI